MRGLLLIVSMAVGLLGCPAGPTYVVQQYPGAPRPPETIAILRVNGKDPTRLVMLDGEDITARVADDTRLHVELLPGRHSVVVVVANKPERASFDAEAGKVYRAIDEGGAAIVHQVDRDTDAPGADVTAHE